MMKHIPNDLLIFYFTFANTKIHSYFLCAIMNKLKNKPFKNMGQIVEHSYGVSGLSRLQYRILKPKL